MFLLLYILLLFSVILLPAMSADIKLLMVIVFLFVAFLDLMLLVYYVVPLIVFIIGLFIWVYSINFSVASRMLSIPHLLSLSVIFGGIIFLLLYLILKYRNIKSFQPNFRLRDTFKLSLPVEKILKYRLAICRDYAKLTAALLLKMYPENNILFISFPSHVATGIQIKNTIYILDQRLPILTINDWLKKWKVKKADCYLLKIKRGKPKVDLKPYIFPLSIPP